MDEGPEDDGTVVQTNGQTTTQNYAPYNQDIMSRLTSDSAGARSWRTMIEAAQYPYDWVLGVAEFVLLWEGMAANYDSQYRAYLPTLPNTLPPPAWWNQPNQQRRIVHTITDYTPGSTGNLPDMVQIADVLSKAFARGAGTVYLADTFGKIPAFWDREVAAYR